MQIAAEEGGIGVLAHRRKCEGVDIDSFIDRLEETAGGAHFFHNEMAQLEDNLAVVRGQHLLHGRVAEGARYKVERRRQLGGHS